MDSPLTPDNQNTVIEEALRTYPILPMPRDVIPDVMVRLQTVPAPRSFRPTWSDLGFSLVFGICIGAVWFSLQNLPPLVVAQIRKESILLYQQLLLNVRWLIPVLSFSLAGVLVALTLPYWRREWME